MRVLRVLLMAVALAMVADVVAGKTTVPRSGAAGKTAAKPAQAIVNEDCVRRVPSSFTAAQKSQLCTALSEGAQPDTSIGPAICASVAKQMLHGSSKFETILQLCQGASSAAPVQCYNKMEATGNTLKAKYGLDLCVGADSTLPGECFAEINAYTGTTNKVKPEILLEFCKSLEDRAPLLCVEAVKDTGLVPVPQSLEMCGMVVGSGSKTDSVDNTAAADCIQVMKAQVKPSFGVTASDILKFCIESNPKAYYEHTLSSDGSDARDDVNVATSAPAECYLQAALVMQSSPTGGVNSDGIGGAPLLTPKQRLTLCANAHTALGPINCTTSALDRDTSGKGSNAFNTGLKPVEVVELCQGAQNSGPAECYVQSRNLGTIAQRTHLCNGAFNAGPAQCYRRAANVFRNDAGNQTLLCISANSEDPAICATEAPHYLSMSEKVDLCGNTPPGHSQDSVRCLNAVAAASKEFKQAPKKALGYFLESLWDAKDRKSRELLLHMCSFSGSQDPIASAQCFKSAPNSLDHDDAARMCTDIPSAELIEHMQLCHRILPKDWGSEEASILCEQTSSREQVEAALKCAVEASTRMMFPKLTKVHAAHVCATETKAGPVLACLRDVSKGVSASSPSAYLVTPETVVAVCSTHAHGPSETSSGSGGLDGTRRPRPMTSSRAGTEIHPGQCLTKLATQSSSKIIFDSSVPAYLCAQQDPAAVLTCLDKLQKRMVNVDDVSTCVNMKQEVKSMRVKKILTEDNGIEIMAGKRFSLWLELLDQFGRRFSDPHQQYLFSASLNANNPQGAVLWGIRSNYSSPHGDGILQLNSLVISQSGPVEFKISVSARSGAVPVAQTSGASSSSRSSSSAQLVEMFHLDVAEDPVVSSAAPCIYVLQQTMCPVNANTPAEWEGEFPRIRSFIPADASHYFRNILCAGEVLNEWHVGAYLSADGGLWAEYRMGIEALWTGVGMPKMEMSPMERLGLFASEDGIKSLDGASEEKSQSGHADKEKSKAGRSARKRERAAQKEIRRAYYRKSLQWHPDRWAGMGMYALAVQGAFELVNEAYNALTAGADENSADAAGGDAPNGTADPVYS